MRLYVRNIALQQVARAIPQRQYITVYGTQKSK